MENQTTVIHSDAGYVPKRRAHMAKLGRRRRAFGETRPPAQILCDDDALEAIEALFLNPHRSRNPGNGDSDSRSPEAEQLLPLSSTAEHIGGGLMSSLNQSVQELLTIPGAVGVAIADSMSGMALAQGGHPSFDLGAAAAGNSNVVRAKLQTMSELGINSRIDDILITLEEQYHLINVLSTAGTEGLFIYLVLDKSTANLALARHKLAHVAEQLVI